MNNTLKQGLLILGGFLFFYFLPGGVEALTSALGSGLVLAREYAREHVIFCLVPAFFIAGSISTLISPGTVLRFLGPRSPRPQAYGVASTSGTLLAVCSCTILPVFAGITRMGAGIGPATAFLYSGPAINILAIVLTLRVLGPGLGVTRALAAVAMSVVVGLAMARIFRDSDNNAGGTQPVAPEGEGLSRHSLAALVFMLAVLVFANIPAPSSGAGFHALLYDYRWILVAASGLGLAAAFLMGGETGILPTAGTVLATLAAFLLAPWPEVPFITATAGLSLSLYLGGGKGRLLLEATFDFTRQILPLLLAGILIAGALLGDRGLIPDGWIVALVGGNGFLPSLGASVAGAFMYFATLTEVPILEGLISSGMGKGPALALLLAGPALSLPNMLVIRSVIGTKKTAVFILLVVTVSTLAGTLYGMIP
jgi:hypothetical protein